MESMPAPAIAVTVGVDTHLDTHVAAVIDQAGRLLDTRPLPPRPAAMSPWSPGPNALGRWNASAWKAPARTGLAWPALSAPPCSRSAEDAPPDDLAANAEPLMSWSTAPDQPDLLAALLRAPPDRLLRSSGSRCPPRAERQAAEQDKHSKPAHLPPPPTCTSRNGPGMPHPVIHRIEHRSPARNIASRRGGASHLWLASSRLVSSSFAAVQLRYWSRPTTATRLPCVSASPVWPA